VRYALRRLGFYMLAAWLSLTVNFFIPRMMPGDPVAIIVGRLQGHATPRVIAALRVQFGGSDAPLWQQYGDYLAQLAHGDLGVSLAYFPAPVTEVIGTGLRWTLILMGCAVVLSFLVGTWLGALAAWRRGGVLDSGLLPLLAFLGAFPYFWLAMGALYVFGLQLGWFPLRHAYTDGTTPTSSLGFVVDVAYHALLPALTIVVATAGGWMLAMRNSMISVLGEDYIELARAKGLTERRVLWAYAARNALLPSITNFGMAIGFVLGGSLLTEVVFSYPGTGYLLVQAVRSQDYALMQGLFCAITLAVLAANLIVDLAYAWLDPRVRLG
jgi:peptide/nickel transport system permease protein